MRQTGLATESYQWEFQYIIIELSRSLLCLPLLLSAVHNFCACWHLYSSCAINTIATLIAPCFIVRRRHRRSSTGTSICEPELDLSHSHEVSLHTSHIYGAPQTLASLRSLKNARSRALDRAKDFHARWARAACRRQVGGDL